MERRIERISMIFGNLFHVIPPAFGLSVSNRNIKFAYITRNGKEFSVKSFGERVFDKKDVVKSEEIRKMLKTKEARSLPPYAVVSLPEEEIFLRIIQVPIMTDEELREAIKWEIEANIPVSIDDVYYDYHIITSDYPSARLRHLDVLITAIPRSVADMYIKAVEDAGIRPLALEPESFALARSLIPEEGTASPTLILDIGYAHTRIAVFSGGNVRFTSFVPFSISNLIKVVASKNHNIPTKEAEAHLFKDGIGIKALHDEFNSFSEQVKKYISFYNSHLEHEHGRKTIIEQVLIAGGGALIPMIDEYLIQEVKIHFATGDPWANIFSSSPYSKTPPMPYRDAIRFASVLGLALRGARPDSFSL